MSAVGLLLSRKPELFRAAIDAEQAWLAMVGIAKTVVSLYPYLRVIAPTVLPFEGSAERCSLTGGRDLAARDCAHADDDRDRRARRRR